MSGGVTGTHVGGETGWIADENARDLAILQRGVFVDHGSTAGTVRPSSSVPVKWFGTVAPTNAITNDEWYDRANEILKRYDGSAWQSAGSATYRTVVNHGSTAGTARPAGVAVVEWRGTVSPTNAQTDDLFLDKSTSPATLKRYTGSAFEAISGTTYAIPLSSASSGTAYTVTAPTHGEARLKLTLTGNAVLTLTGGTAGEVCAVQLQLIQDATGSRSVTWPGSVDWGVNGAPVLSTAATKADRIYLTTDDGGASWQGALIGTGYTSPLAPSAPTLVSASSTSTSVTLTWTQGAANGSTVTQNKIYRGSSAGTETLLATISAGTTYTDSGLSAGTYYYKVSAVNAVGESPLSSEVSGTPGTVTLVADTFTAADSATALTGAVTPTGSKTWTKSTGSAMAWGYASNQAYHSDTGANTGYLYADAAQADVTVTVDYIPGATNPSAGHGLIFRGDGTLSNYIQLAAFGASGWYIQKTVGGVTSNVINSAATITGGTTYTLSVTMSGSAITVKINGTPVAGLSCTISDAGVLSNTKHGIGSGGNGGASTTDERWDNFTVTQP